MEMLGEAEIRYAINGLLSLTPDANPVLGETVEVRNLWSAAAVWIKEGPGIAQLVAEWMTYGYPHMCDPHGSDISRFYPHEKTEHHINARCAEHFNKTYGIVHPREQWASQRGMRRSPFYAREEALGAVFFDARGWERPQWFESNAKLMEKFPEACKPREHEWDARWWSPITNAEHLQMRESVGMVDLTAFNEFDFTGPGAVRLPPVHVRQQRRRRRRPQRLHAAAHAARRLPRRPHHPAPRRRALPRHHRCVRRWPRQLLVPQVHADATARSRSPTGRRASARSACGARTPRRRWPRSSPITSKPYDVSRRQGFPYGAVREVLIDGVPCTMFRISYVGENGWEIYTHMEHGLRLWDTIAEAGEEFEHHPRRHRRVRRHRPHREGLPPDGRRARERVQPGRGRPRPPEGEVAPTSSARRPT